MAKQNTSPKAPRNGSWVVNVRIGADERLSVEIPRDTEVEQALRRGASQVNTLLSRYQNAYPHSTPEQHLTYVALHIAKDLTQRELAEERTNTDDYLKRIRAALDRIDDEL